MMRANVIAGAANHYAILKALIGNKHKPATATIADSRLRIRHLPAAAASSHRQCNDDGGLRENKAISMHESLIPFYFKS